mmetsp:Transcript_28328/g.53253  ORF Transcript_28328/g.53253 Transcript_28328/m.53253 type:complete len:160 (+) Transcript_28328:430-909(+)
MRFQLTPSRRRRLPPQWPNQFAKKQRHLVEGAVDAVDDDDDDPEEDVGREDATGDGKDELLVEKDNFKEAGSDKRVDEIADRLNSVQWDEREDGQGLDTPPLTPRGSPRSRDSNDRDCNTDSKTLGRFYYPNGPPICPDAQSRVNDLISGLFFQARWQS